MPRVVRDKHRSVMQQDGADDGGVPQLRIDHVSEAAKQRGVIEPKVQRVVR
jgi:hypothetical protein